MKRLSPLWLLLIFPLAGIVAAAVILIDSERPPEIASVPLPAPVTFIPPTPLPTTPPEQGELLGAHAPELIFTTLDGEEIHLHDLEGNVVFLNFWATWCVPCQEEMPALQTFQDEHDNVSVIAITDPALGQTEDDIRSFVETYKVTFPVALTSELDLFNQFDVLQLPLTFIVDPQGVIRYQHVGALTIEDMTEYWSELSG